MAMIFNPPPNWPKPPENWKPTPTWRPDPAWGPVPDGWQLWIEEPDPEPQEAPQGAASAAPLGSPRPQASTEAAEDATQGGGTTQTSSSDEQAAGGSAGQAGAADGSSTVHAAQHNTVDASQNQDAQPQKAPNQNEAETAGAGTSGEDGVKGASADAVGAGTGGAAVQASLSGQNTGVKDTENKRTEKATDQALVGSLNTPLRGTLAPADRVAGGSAANAEHATGGTAPADDAPAGGAINADDIVVEEVLERRRQSAKADDAQAEAEGQGPTPQAEEQTGPAAGAGGAAADVAASAAGASGRAAEETTTQQVNGQQENTQQAAAVSGAAQGSSEEAVSKTEQGAGSKEASTPAHGIAPSPVTGLIQPLQGSPLIEFHTTAPAAPEPEEAQQGAGSGQDADDAAQDTAQGTDSTTSQGEATPAEPAQSAADTPEEHDPNASGAVVEATEQEETDPSWDIPVYFEDDAPTVSTGRGAQFSTHHSYSASSGNPDTQRYYQQNPAGAGQEDAPITPEAVNYGQQGASLPDAEQYSDTGQGEQEPVSILPEPVRYDDEPTQPERLVPLPESSFPASEREDSRAENRADTGSRSGSVEQGGRTEQGAQAGENARAGHAYGSRTGYSSRAERNSAELNSARGTQRAFPTESSAQSSADPYVGRHAGSAASGAAAASEDSGVPAASTGTASASPATSQPQKPAQAQRQGLVSDAPESAAKSAAATQKNHAVPPAQNNLADAQAGTPDDQQAHIFANLDPEPDTAYEPAAATPKKPNFFTTPLGWASIGGVVLLVILLIVALALSRGSSSASSAMPSENAAEPAASESSTEQPTTDLKMPSGDFKEYTGQDKQTIDIEKPNGSDSKALLYYEFSSSKERGGLTLTGKNDKDQATLLNNVRDVGNTGSTTVGMVWVDVNGVIQNGATRKLQVEAEGKWVIRIYDASSAPRYDKGDTFGGKMRNYAFVYTGGSGSFDATSTNIDNNEFYHFRLDALGRGSIVGTSLTNSKTSAEWKDSGNESYLAVVAPYSKWELSTH